MIKKSKKALHFIKGILFDKDGTLFDFHKTWIVAAQEAAALASGGDIELAQELLAVGGFDFSTGRFLPDSVIAAGNTRELTELWVDLGAVLPEETLHARMEDVFNRLALENASPVTDLETLFSFFRDKDIYTGIATNDSYAGAFAAVKEFKLKNLTNFVAGYDSGFGSKPGPGMVNAFCRKTGLSSEKIAVVGDSEHDMQMGRSGGAGLLVGVLTGAGTKQSLRNSAHLIIEDISCLKDLMAPI
ncbi:MAG: HAD family hydrolase [Desulfonatronovibrio sp.]|nr:HAD family hydrolase [Desulfovibrionales bacterium]